MQNRFHELKRQLAELSETINKFESEAVQLRIVELIFSQTGGFRSFAEPDGQTYEPGPARPQAPARGERARGGRRARAVSSPAKAPQRNALPSASGAVAALARLVESGYFKEKRTIGDVVKHCRDEYDVRYKSNAFSGPLSRLANKSILKREKNAEGNFVYFE
ncbi:hypothetical protein [Chelativorans sp.]|uniref:hypothetical protein n=1 Tax=Chelativorans sp. TaxID=2203393 RepID=UPI002810AB9A|nr:hypothetical protein [Chelativorans sp.]